ncbi:hypothetical protein MTR_5g020480 [Medicago truncatula]|uniref:Uncharacterized protein n=1 Tax=Medicago truncatula TaxID=3880 RepID=G7KDM9_MEDTR|nr:hypothetical protein MTR_5g020480 [Medicago truncatula]
MAINGACSTRADSSSSSVPNFHPYYGSMMRYSSQTPSFNGYMPMENENFPNVGASQFPEFSTQK